MNQQTSVTLHDIIINFLRDNPNGVSSEVIAEKFLKIRYLGATAHIAVNGILSKDQRCSYGSDKLWHAKQISAPTTERLSDLPWSAVFTLMHPTEQRLMYVSIWHLSNSPTEALSGWMVDPATLPADEHENLVGTDECREQIDSDNLIRSCGDALQSRIPVFLMSSHWSRFNQAMIQSDCDFVIDDAVTISELMRAADLSVPRPFSFEHCVDAVLAVNMIHSQVKKKAALYADCIFELLRMLGENGIESRTQLDEQNSRNRQVLFADKEFSYNDLLNTPSEPGVYGFRDKQGTYLYIGKARNLKRRLLSYFRESEESPGKLQKLRAEAHDFIVHRCGSELEALLYEYRLIKKHSPSLNRQTQINERSGKFTPIDDCIVLLPSNNEGKGVSFWFRRDQKILIRPFDTDFNQREQFVDELSTFFLNEKLAPEQSDFPEQEIATRWIKRHFDKLSIVPVSRMANAHEIYDGMKSYWKDVPLQR